MDRIRGPTEGFSRRAFLILLALGLHLAVPGSLVPQAQDSPRTGWEFTGLPALNFDSDEGFGYGVILALYDYGPRGSHPYRAALRPTLFFTTEGRKELSLFVDLPHLPGQWRFSSFLGFEKRIATPYYGIGNRTDYDPALEEGPNPYFYRFGQERWLFSGKLQKPIRDWPLRVLLGGQVADFTIDPTPKNEGMTLLQNELGPGSAMLGGNINSILAGMVWDTRDRESGPTRGAWTEGLVEWAGEALGRDESFTRLTLTDRRYFTLSRGLVFANRVTLQDISGSPPFYALTVIQSSYETSEGLGGAKSARGILRNRYAGKGLFLWNAELRWRALEFRILGKNAHLALIGFLDSGRVWSEGVELGSLLSHLHHGYGGGLRTGLGPNFVVATDAATSKEVGLQIYIGLGYLF